MRVASLGWVDKNSGGLSPATLDIRSQKRLPTPDHSRPLPLRLANSIGFGFLRSAPRE
jgi:hypothetical protein